jgi:hypothetical protein
MNQTAPSAEELARHPAVRQAIEEAWSDSRTEDPGNRHEEGGWIYLDTTTGEITTVRAGRGRNDLVDLRNPPLLPGTVIVGKFHTHPNPSAEGWEPGPSPDDIMVDEVHGVPDLIRADDGLHVSGPDRRRGGLGGNPRFPNEGDE